jgi:acyl carrier protein
MEKLSWRRTPAQGSDATALVLIEGVEKLVSELHPHRARVQPVTLDSSLDRDLGLDSLARVELLAHVENSFGVTIPERVFADAETVRDLLRAIEGSTSAKASGRITEVTHAKPGESITSPHSAQTLVEVLDWHARKHPDRPHIRLYSDEGDGEIITYRQLTDGATVLAAGLQQRGVQTGEPVAVMLPTGLEYFLAFFGILLAGGIPVPIYPPARKSQLADHLRRHRAILSNCGALTLITVPEAKGFAQLLKSLVESLRNLVTVQELGSTVAPFYEPKLAGRSTAFLQYTSGSTGSPKGVILTHANLLANIRAMGEAARVQSADVFVSWLPLYHDMGLIGAWLGSLYYATPLVIMSPLDFIARPQRWLWAIHRYRGSLSASPNFGFELCLKRLKDEDLKGLDLTSWRAAFNGAEPVSPTTVERFSRRFARYGFRREAMTPVYGLAECSVGLAFPPLDRGPVIDRIEREPFMRDGRAIPGAETETGALSFVASGRPLRGHEVRVVDSAGRELPDRREGRLQFRGPSASSGYIRSPDETELLFHGNWLNSGDLAYIAEGDIYITGRTKDIIIRAGRNIYPQEIEEAVGSIAGIRKGSVVAFGSTGPDAATERLVIVAETYETEPQLLDELRSMINARTIDLLGMPPEEIIMARPKAILKTSSGKVRRGANRELYERGRFGKRQRPAWWQITRIALEGLKPKARRMALSASAGLYAAYGWLLIGLFAPFVWSLVVALPHISRHWAVVRGAARAFLRASRTPLSVEGLENLPRDRACVLVANHASYLDGLALVAALPGPLSFVAKAELAGRWITRLPLRKLRTHFVERFDKQMGIENVRDITRSASEEKPLVFFAEGTFTRVPGLLPFHMGAFMTAAERGMPVVPIAIRGTRSLLRSGSWFPRRGAITIHLGKPIAPGEMRRKAAADLWAAALRLRDSVREDILRHCGEPDLAHEKWPI